VLGLQFEPLHGAALRPPHERQRGSSRKRGPGLPPVMGGQRRAGILSGCSRAGLGVVPRRGAPASAHVGRRVPPGVPSSELTCVEHPARQRGQPSSQTADRSPEGAAPG
jgi:hypothetical protein